MLTIYRVQAHNGWGAFEETPMGLWEDAYPGGIEAYMVDHPMPYADGLGQAFYEPFEVRYGCCTLDQLLHWFPPCIVEAFIKSGYGENLQLTVWRVPPEDVFHGGHQVAFRPDRAECIERRPVATLHAELPLAA